jgi:hypothetical protein
MRRTTLAALISALFLASQPVASQELDVTSPSSNAGGAPQAFLALRSSESESTIVLDMATGGEVSLSEDEAACETCKYFAPWPRPATLPTFEGEPVEVYFYGSGDRGTMESESTPEGASFGFIFDSKEPVDFELAPGLREGGVTISGPFLIESEKGRKRYFVSIDTTQLNISPIPVVPPKPKPPRPKPRGVGRR